ncbi:patatin-like phospholipase family protein [Candidatus Odyssella acanthamoebae]|uniref:PNPLA domain-containing protein n=1 Tax=Candidatus Odyssella acanthamoebae TaxID=91604 RepID=A0A077B1C2_9PROT|nr:patatin-like phospholipase family protein [Candidatus Paracaedibacter acanthamoebae]AIK96740.1 hypothetical protein ID47_08420 [Candidatus Paracaedibacter acanthamoebae]
MKKILFFLLPILTFFLQLTPLKAMESRVEYAGLSIDGGGIRSLVSLKVLIALEDAIHEHAPKKHLSEMFDYIGGTSGGGTLALALTLPPPMPDQQPPSLGEWLDIFIGAKNVIFPKSRKNYIKQFFWGSRYSPKQYEEHLKNWFGPLTLSDLTTDVVVTSTQLETQKPYLFTKEKAIRDEKYNFLLRDVARATTAVVSQYPAYRVSTATFSTPLLIDGCISFINSSQFIVNRIMKNSRDENFRKGREVATHNNIYMLSLGGDVQISDTNKNTGNIWLLPYFINHFREGANDGVNHEMKSLLGDNYKRIVPTSEIEKIKYDDATDEVIIKIDEVGKDLINKLKSKGEIEDTARKLLYIYDRKNEHY